MSLQSAARKLQHQSGREWGAYLTPTEIVALTTAGARPTVGSRSLVERAKQDVVGGKSNPTWFYCTLGDNTEAAKAVRKAKG